MTREQVLRKKTGIVLAVIGIVLSFLPAVRMADETKLFIFQLIGNERFFPPEITADNSVAFIIGILLCTILIYGLFVHILNLILWLRKTEKTYLGVMGFSWASIIGMAMSVAMASMMGYGYDIVSLFPFTIWQSLRILVIFAEIIIKLHGEELFAVFFPEK